MPFKHQLEKWTASGVTTKTKDHVSQSLLHTSWWFDQQEALQQVYVDTKLHSTYSLHAI